MEHVVFYPTSDGAPAFGRVPSLEEAVRLVEYLRNVEGVPEVGVHALTEVPLSFRPWIRVELPVSGHEPAAVDQPAAEQPGTPSLEPAVAVVPEQVAAAPILVEPTPAESSAPEPVVAEPAATERSDADVEPVLEPVAAGNGHVEGGPKSLGFFA